MSMEYLIKKRKTNAVVLIDKEDFDLVDSYSWSINSSGYAIGFKKALGCKSARVMMHRLIMGLPPKDIVCDHQDRNPLNNQKSNLRKCTKGQNNRNRKAATGSQSKYLGVSILRKKNRKPIIIARISVDNKDRYLGSFSTEEAAARAYDKAASQIAGEFANLNFKSNP